MSGEKCSLCGMKVLNMEVHIKLNHKKKKSTKTDGLRFTGFIQSTYAAACALAPLPSITKYQKTQCKSSDKLSKEGSNKTDRSDTTKASQFQRPCIQETNHSNQDEERWRKSLAMLGDLLDQETARKIYKLDDVNDSVMNDIFKSGFITKEGFEMKLKLLGMIRIGNTYKKLENRSVKYCPDCGQAFHWVKQRRGENREYFDHIQTCGLESNYSKFETDKNETLEQMVNLENIEQLEPEINMFVKEEIEIKTEIPDEACEIVVKKETVDTNDEDLEAEYGEQLMLKKLQVIQHPLARLQSNLKNITAPETNIAIKTEPVDAGDTDLFTDYDIKCQVKVEPVDDSPQEIPSDEKEPRNNFETPSLDLISEKTEESFAEPMGMLDTVVNINVLDELVKDMDTTPSEVHEVKTDMPASTSQTENIGDAWFKKISEIEMKTFTCNGIFESSVKKLNWHKKARKIDGNFKSRKTSKNLISNPICKRRKQKRKKVMKS